MMRRIGLVALALILLLAGIVATMRMGWWATDRAEMEARWAQAPSQFAMVDGVRLHYRDEGEGPIVVLLHGSIVNLHEWSAVVPLMTGRFRVIRLDWPPYGLSGPDPTGEYTTARAAELLDGLLRQIGADDFTLVSTSNGANVALEYNRRFPGHARAMAFSVLPLERPSQTRKIDWRIRAMMPFHNYLVPDWHSHLWFRLILEDTTPDSFSPTSEMVDSIYATANLPGAAQHQRDYIASNTRLFQTTDFGAIAETVHVPVLLQWPSYDTVISQGPQPTIERFTNTDVELVEYPDLGHFLMWEDPERFTADLTDFIDRVNAADAASRQPDADKPPA